MIYLPKISIVTPSFNQGKFLEKTILSVLEQDYPNLEYIIIDGGSTDNSVEIIRKYEKRLAYWVSEPDRGQSNAINKGFERATGEIFGWLNSDDWYAKGALQSVAEAFAANPDAGALVGAGEMVDEEGKLLSHLDPFDVNVESLYRWLNRYFWQPSCFFTHDAWELCGPLDEDVHFAMDLDLWLKIAKKYRFATTNTMLSSSLKHAEAKTTTSDYYGVMDAVIVIVKHAGEKLVRSDINTYANFLVQKEYDYKFQIDAYANTLAQKECEYKFQIDAYANTLAQKECEYKFQIEDRNQTISTLTSRLESLSSDLHALRTSNKWIIANLLFDVGNRFGLIPIVKTLLVLKRKGLGSFAALNKQNVSLLISQYRHRINKSISVFTQPINNSLTLGVKDRVSIILPVYNHANYLEEAIEGVLSQTYQNIELIVVNDGSTDGVERILSKYVDNHKVIILVQDNQKLPAALNNGFKFASGEFYTWTSADNIMHPNQIEILVRYLKRNTEMAMVFSDYQAIDDKGNPLSAPNFRPHNQDSNDKSLIRLPNMVTEQNLHDSGDNYIGASFMYRRDTAWVVGNYDTGAFGGEDYDYWLRLHNLFEIGHIKDILYKYRVHDNTLNAKAHELKLFDNIKKLLERDRQRREFLREDFNYFQIGTNYLLSSGNPGNQIILFNYSNYPDLFKLDKNNIEKSLLVCQINISTNDIELDLLSSADIVIVQDQQQFHFLEDTLNNRVYLLDIENNKQLFGKITKNRLFDKQNLVTKSTETPTVYCNRKLNIALQVETMDKGGLEQVVVNLVRGINRNKFNVTLLVCSGQLGYHGNMLSEQGYEVIYLDKNESKLQQVIEERNIDLVNLHHSIWGLDKYKKNGVATLYTVHNSYTWFNESQIRERKLVFSDIDYFITVSNQVRHYFTAKFEVPYSKTRTIPNGVDLSDFEGVTEGNRAQYGFEEDDFIFINVAAINGIKFQSLMLSGLREVLCEHPNAKLLFVGNVLDQKYHEFLHDRIQNEGLENNVLHIDYVRKQELGSLLSMSNCFLMPSIQEGWSNAIMEAMCFGLPLILSDTGSARDIIKNNDIGIIINNPYKNILNLSPEIMSSISYQKKPENLNDLINAMTKMISEYNHWTESGSRSIKLVQKYSLANMTDKTQQLYIECYYYYRKHCAFMKN